MELFGYISAICFFVGYLPQLWRTYKLRSVDDISVWMWVLTLIAYLSGLTYGIWLDKWPLILSYLLGLSCTVLMLIMYHMWYDPRKDAVRKEVDNFIKDARRKFDA